MPQLNIHYLYRDASNYKNHGSLVIQNGQGLTAQEFSLALREQFADLQSFPDVLHFPQRFWAGRLCTSRIGQRMISCCTSYLRLKQQIKMQSLQCLHS